MCGTFLCSAQTQASGADELMSEMLQDFNKIGDNLSTKQRLDKYEDIFKNLNEIYSEYSDSEYAIKLLSNQSIGNFNPAVVRKNYINELSSYYDKVCETTPTLSCLGFVSLKTGVEQCETARSVPQLNQGHDSILNAIQLFLGQEKDSVYGELAMDAYRSCTSSARRYVSQWQRDYYATQLISPLVSIGQRDMAKAVIENMESPYFKFEGVLSLEQQSVKKKDAAYIKRLQRYIDEKMPTDSVDTMLAKIRLGLFSMERSNMKHDYSSARDAVYGRLRRNDRNIQCGDGEFPRYVFDLITDYQTSLYNLDPSLRNINAGQMKIVMTSAADAPYKTVGITGEKIKDPRGVGYALDSCAKTDENANYSLMALIHGYLLLDQGRDVAKDFLKLAKQNTMNEEELYSYYIDKSVHSLDELNQKIAENESSFVANLLIQPKARFAVYKKRVDFGDVCEASKMLFQELKQTDSYSKAINYMYSSDAIDFSNKYSCGDEELELLLN